MTTLDKDFQSIANQINKHLKTTMAKIERTLNRDCDWRSSSIECA